MVRCVCSLGLALGWRVQWEGAWPLSSGAHPLGVLPVQREKVMVGRPCQGRSEWAQPPRKAALTSLGPANWERPVPACLWENRPLVPRALPVHLHKTFGPCQFLPTDPSSCWKNRSLQHRGAWLTRAQHPETWTLTHRRDTWVQTPDWEIRGAPASQSQPHPASVLVR